MNPNETRGTDDPVIHSEVCPMCGMERRDWVFNEGRGYIKDGEEFCCVNCAEGEPCNCTDTVSPNHQ